MEVCTIPMVVRMVETEAEVGSNVRVTVKFEAFKIFKATTTCRLMLCRLM